MHLERWQVKKNKELQDPDGSLDYFPLKKTQLSVTMANGDGDRYVPDEPGASWSQKANEIIWEGSQSQSEGLLLKKARAV